MVCGEGRVGDMRAVRSRCCRSAPRAATPPARHELSLRYDRLPLATVIMWLYAVAMFCLAVATEAGLSPQRHHHVSGLGPQLERPKVQGTCAALPSTFVQIA